MNPTRDQKKLIHSIARGLEINKKNMFDKQKITTDSQKRIQIIFICVVDLDEIFRFLHKT